MLTYKKILTAQEYVSAVTRKDEVNSYNLHQEYHTQGLTPRFPTPARDTSR